MSRMVSPGSHRPGSHHSSGTGIFGVVFVVGVVWFVLALIFPPVAVLGGYAFAAVIGTGVGAWHGLWAGLALGWQVLVTLAQLTVAPPLLEAAITGVVAGLVIAWLQTAAGVKERGSNLVSAVFSAEPWRKGGGEFWLLLVSHAIAGYFIMLAFAAIGLAATEATAGPTVEAVTALAFGGGGPGGDGLLHAYMMLLAIIVALVLTGVLVGAVVGSAVGLALAPGVWAFDLAHLVGGATQGATVRWFAPNQAHKTGSFALYLACGAFAGAIEGLLVGALAGFITGIRLYVG